MKRRLFGPLTALSFLLAISSTAGFAATYDESIDGDLHGQTIPLSDGVNTIVGSFGFALSRGGDAVVAGATAAGGTHRRYAFDYQSAAAMSSDPVDTL